MLSNAGAKNSRTILVTIKKAFLAFLWLFSILATADLTTYFTSSTAWVWETKPWIRRIKHWPEPIVAFVGNTPLYQSDIRNAFDGLPNHAPNVEQKMKSTVMLRMTADTIMWRDAAQSFGVFQSIYPSQRLETEKNIILTTWLNPKYL